MKKGEFKTIQIVALFVTVAAFVLSQVKIYENRSGLESMAISLSFAGILLLFNGFLNWMVNIEKEKKYGFIKNSIIIASFVLISLSFLIFWGTSNYGNFSSNEIKKIDTIATNHDQSQIKDINLLKKTDSLYQIKQKKEDSVIIKIREAIKLK